MDFSLWVTGDDYWHFPRLVKQIRATGFEGNIWAISDGPVPPDDRIIETDSQIKNIDIGGFLLRQFIILLDRSTATGFIHVDPDSEVWRIPDQPKSKWCGRVFQADDCTGTWGCGVYYSREIIEAIVDNPINEYHSYDKGYSADLTIASHLNNLGYFPEPWDQVHLGRGVPKVRNTGRWSITHRCYSFGMQVELIEKLIPEGSSVLECGSGRSTLLLDKLIEEGHIESSLSLEHDMDYAPATHFAKIVHCPLVDGFYDCSAIEGQFGVLIIDGPPVAGRNHLGLFIERLGQHLEENALVIIDDYQRDSDKEYIDNLVSDGVLSLEDIVSKDGKAIAVGRLTWL